MQSKICLVYLLLILPQEKFENRKSTLESFYNNFTLVLLVKHNALI